MSYTIAIHSEKDQGFSPPRFGIGRSYSLLTFVVISNRHDRAKAVDILVKDLKVFSTFNEELFKEITQLLTLENFRLFLPVLCYHCCLCSVILHDEAILFLGRKKAILKASCNCD